MVPVVSQLIAEVTAHAQSESLEDVREICVDGTYFPDNLRIYIYIYTHTHKTMAPAHVRMYTKINLYIDTVVYHAIHNTTVSVIL